MADTIVSRLLFGIDTREFRNGIRNMDRDLQALSKNVQNIGNVIGATFAVGMIQDFTVEAVKLGDQLAAAQQGFKRFGDAKDMEGLRKATKGMVTDVKLLQSAIQAGNFGIPIQELGNLFKFAQLRAKETGQAVDYLTESVVIGIGRKSPLILDNLGISAIQLRERLGGVSAEMASIAEVTQAVSSIASEEIAKMGDSIEDATTQATQLSVKWENFKSLLGKSLSEDLSSVKKLAEGFLDLGMAAQFYIEYGTAASKLVFFGGREESSGSFKNAMLDVNQAISDQQWAINDLKRIYEKFNPPVTKTITTLGGLKEKLAELQKEYEETDVASPRFAQLRKEIEKLDNQLKKLTKPEVLKQVVFYSEAAAEYLRDINEELFKGTDYWITYGDRMAEALDPSGLENFAVSWQETEHEFIPGIRNLSKEFETLNSLIDITANTLGNSLQQSLSSVFNLAVLKQELKGLQEEFKNMDTSNLRFNELSQEIERLQEQISSIDGDFFKTLIDSLKKMAIQLAATAGAALALSVILKSLGIGGGATIGQIFKVVGGQMGLPGLGGSSFNPLTANVEGGLFGGRTTLRGNDIFLANSRSGYDLGRIGG